MEIKIANDVLTVGKFTELTAANNELFRKQICTALNGHTTIEIDLSRTTFMDCAGLGALIALRHFASSRNGVVRLVNPSPPLQRLFDWVRAGQMFEIINAQPADQALPATVISLARSRSLPSVRIGPSA
jgi:anti-anti-sigma factor